MQASPSFCCSACAATAGLGMYVAHLVEHEIHLDDETVQIIEGFVSLGADLPRDAEATRLLTPVLRDAVRMGRLPKEVDSAVEIFDVV